MTINSPDAVVDVDGVHYPLDRLLGQGGQGAVYAVRGKDLAVKLLGVRQPSARERVRENIARLRRLPLQRLKVARPLRALAEPFVGYVMELMTGMVPLKTLVNVPRDLEGDFSSWYLKTGSLKRRLRLLARTAELFRDLHAAGLTYGDASPGNIFMSETQESNEVWLIDCDNVYQGVSPRAVYTPGYAAPELFRGHPGADSLTDAWSLATIVFETLCVTHPFIGELVHNSEPENEEKAFRGELPWIGDTNDNSNAPIHGLPMEMVLTPPLQSYAGRCFADSRLERQNRPSAGAWADSLHQAADQTLVCPACNSSYYFTCAKCPWCDEPRPSFAIITFYHRDTSLTDDSRTPYQVVCNQPGKPSAVARTMVQHDRWTKLADRHLKGTCSDTIRISACLKGHTLVLKGTEASATRLAHRRDGKSVPLDGRTERVALQKGKSWWWLVPETPLDIHRVATFTLYKGAAS